MDVAGLVLGVVGVIKPLTETAVSLCNGIEALRNYDSDLNSLRLRIEITRRQISSFEDVVMGNRKLNWLKGSLFDELPANLQREFYDLLQELKRVLMLFIEEYKTYVPAMEGTTQSYVAGSTCLPSVKSPPFPNSQLTKIPWMVVGKSKLTNLVTDIEHWTSLLRLSVQDVLTNFPGLQSLERIDNFGQALEEKVAEMQLTLILRKVLLSKTPYEHSRARHIPDGFLKPVSPDSDSNVCLFEGNYLYVERKMLYREDLVKEEKQLDRVRQLVNLLKHSTDPHFRVFTAQGYSYAPDGSFAKILYTIPTTLIPYPVSLHQLYSVKFREHRPSLELRFQLATSLVESLFYLHSWGWIHRSLSSHNILFFPQSAKRSSPWLSGTDQRQSISILDVFENSEMKMLGFELARPETAESSLSLSLREDPINLYRHPLRWGKPTVKFAAIHDLYSLGVVLLEVGLWQSANKLDDCMLGQGPEKTQEILLRHASLRLPYTMGTKYTKIVCDYLKAGIHNPKSVGTACDKEDCDLDNILHRTRVLQDLHKASRFL